MNEKFIKYFRSIDVVMISQVSIMSIYFTLIEASGRIYNFTLLKKKIFMLLSKHLQLDILIQMSHISLPFSFYISWLNQSSYHSICTLFMSMIYHFHIFKQRSQLQILHSLNNFYLNFFLFLYKFYVSFNDEFSSKYEIGKEKWKNGKKSHLFVARIF